MADKKNYLVRNLNNKKCGHCDGVHEYLSRAADRAPCGTPVAWSLEMANEIAGKAEKLDLNDAVVLVPDDTIVVLDDSARKLRRSGSGVVPLDQVHATMRMA